MNVNMFCPVCGVRLQTDGADGYICSQRNGCGSEWDTETLERASWVECEVPVRFYDDHRGRDLPSGREVSRTERRVRVELDFEGYTDLLGDAQHYVDMGVEAFGHELFGLIRSAQATVRALETVVRPSDL